MSTTAVTQVEITAKDSTAAAFASANRNLSGFGSSAASMAAQIAGVGLSVAGLVSGIKEVAQATIKLQQITGTLNVGVGSVKGAAEALSFVREESKRLGLDLATAAEQFAKLSAASKGTQLQGKATRDLFSAMSVAATVLGLSADETRGALNAFQQMISKGKVQAEELRGQLGERLPGAFQMAARAMGVTTAELDKLLVAGKVTAEELLPKMTAELNKTFGSQAEESAKNLQAQINRMNTAMFDLKIAIGETGLIDFLSSGIELATKLGNALTNAFNGDKKLGAVDKQINLIKDLESELERMQGINNIIPISDFIFSKKDTDLIKHRIEVAKEDLEKLKAIAATPVPGEKPSAPNRVETDAKGAADALKALRKKQDELLSREHEYIKLLQIERKQREEILKPFADSAKKAEDQATALENEITALKFAKDNQISLQEAVEKTTIARLEESKAAQKDPEIVAQINAEIEARRKIADLIPIQKQLQDETKSTTDQVSELWKQAGRNIQTIFANGIFDSFDNGLKGMISSAKTAALRILSEFAALKISQSIGLAGLFSSSGIASASTGSSRVGGIAGLLNLASIGTSIKSGFGLTGLLGDGLSSIGGDGLLGLFGSGISGGSSGAAFIAAESATAGAGLAAGAGSMLGAAAGPLAIAFAGTQILKSLAGNKRLGGGLGGVINAVGDLPIIGDLAFMVPIINGLFGRGPIKQKETQLTGDVGLEGLLSAYLTTNFKAKGGAFVGSKHDFAGVNLLTGSAETDNKNLQGVADSMLPYASNLANTLKSSVLGITAQVKSVSDALNISLDPLEGFRHQINLISESGKALTDEQIAGEISAIGDEIVTKLMPSIHEFSKGSETALQTFNRLGQEFGLLEQAALSTGRSFAQSRDAILGMSIASRTGIIDQLGGVDAAGQKIGFFLDNFLSDAEKTRILFDQLDPQMQKLGFSAAITRGEFVKLVQSVGQIGGITTEQYTGLLNLAGQFDNLDKIRGNLASSTGALVDKERSLLDIRNELASTYQKERSSIEGSISQFSQLATQIKGARDSLLLGDLSPLTPGQRLEEARNQFNQTRTLANSGDQNALAKLPQVAQDFLKASQVANASGAAYVSDFNLVQNVLQNAEQSALSQIDILQGQLSALDDSVKNLVDINGGTKTTNQLLRDLLNATLNSSGNVNVSTGNIVDFLKNNPGLSPDQIGNKVSQYGIGKDQLIAAGIPADTINKYTGGATVADKQILDFVNYGASPMDIYNAAIANGISSQRLASVTGWNVTDINDFVKKNNLPSFDVGTDFISKTGLAMVHRAEAIMPSSAIDEIKKLREELAQLRAEQNRQTGDLINVIDITNKQNADAIAKSNRETAKDQQWSDRSKAALA